VITKPKFSLRKFGNMASTHEEDTFVVEEFEISDESDDDLFENMSDDGETFSSEEDDEDVGLESTLRSLKRFVYFLFFHTNIYTHNNTTRTQTRYE
jgi:hypothetical protein